MPSMDYDNKRLSKILNEEMKEVCGKKAVFLSVHEVKLMHLKNC